jgi:hypothetical protein
MPFEYLLFFFVIIACNLLALAFIKMLQQYIKEKRYKFNKYNEQYFSNTKNQSYEPFTSQY